jgi:hypothetical protein
VGNPSQGRPFPNVSQHHIREEGRFSNGRRLGCSDEDLVYHEILIFLTLCPSLLKFYVLFLYFYSSQAYEGFIQLKLCFDFSNFLMCLSLSVQI